MEENKALKELFEELVSNQEAKLLKYGSSIVPQVTSDDILQPNDYSELENHPYFRYEEGVLKGLQTAQMAFLAWCKDMAHPS